MCTEKGEEIAATVQTVEREKQFAASLQQTVVRQAAPGRARKEAAVATLSCAAKCCSHAGPFAEGILLSYKMVINAKFLSLFSLWLGFIIEIKDRR